MSPEPNDMMALGREAMDVAAGLNLEIVRDGKELIQGPAVGTKLEKDERLAQHRALFDTPGSIEAQFAEMSGRFGLTPEKPIPRRLVNRLRRAAKELAEEDDNGTNATA